ncbi:LacI family DNA-binding transcriptional regulator [Lentilactobacillus farraginis]|nr:LacI family DNA-binding transcriptional regulator [Lentilactobacillus farraginis]
MRAKISDIAKLAGVSTASVSRVLNHQAATVGKRLNES